MSTVKAAKPKAKYYPKLGHLPGHWSVIKFGDAFTEAKDPVEVDDSIEYSEIGIRSHGKGLFYKEPVTGAKLGDKSVYWVQPDCLVANIVFAWEQGIARTTEAEVGMIASHRFPMFKAKDDVVDLDFVLYFFKTGRGRIILDHASPGGAGRNKTLSRTELFRSLIPLPPLTEQRRIARILGTWDKAIALLGQQIAAKEERLRGLIDQLVSGTRHGAKDGKLPKGWRWVRLGEVFEFRNGYNTSKEFYGSGVPFVNVLDVITHRKLMPSRIKGKVQIPKDAWEANDVRDGDLLFNRTSELTAEVGLGSVYMGGEVVTFGGFVIRGRPKGQLFDKNFLAYAIRQPGVRKQITAMGSGAIRSNIGQNDLVDVRIPLPPMEDQRSIGHILTAMDDEANLLRAQLVELQEQKRGLMQGLLGGGMFNKP